MSDQATTLTFRGREITVTYVPAVCIHSGKCCAGLPEVFDSQSDPWIRPGRASADRVAAVVARCPSGALRFTRTGTPDAERSDP